MTVLAVATAASTSTTLTTTASSRQLMPSTPSTTTLATVALAPQELTSGLWQLGLDSLVLSEVLTLSVLENPALHSLVQDRKCIEIYGCMVWVLCQ